MRRSLPILALLLALPAGGGAWARDAALPNRYSAAGLDGPLVQIRNPVDGRFWSFWAYRSGAEYDLAISLQREDGSWSEPSFLGEADSLSQVQPAAAVDDDGNVYLAFAVRESGQILMSTLRRGSESWSIPAPFIREPGRHSAPALQIVGRRLIVAYRWGSAVGITVLPLFGADTPSGIQDGPDSLPLPGTPGEGIQRER